jgi:DNA invertase Pin-like site-specific DNA recombinase
LADGIHGTPTLNHRGRSLADLVVTLRELADVGVGSASLTEALDLTTPTGRAVAGLLAAFAEFEREILRERGRAGITQARKEGHPHDRPPLASLKAEEAPRLKTERSSHSAIARRLGIGRTSVRRMLTTGRRPRPEPNRAARRPSGRQGWPSPDGYPLSVRG